MVIIDAQIHVWSPDVSTRPPGCPGALRALRAPPAALTRCCA